MRGSAIGLSAGLALIAQPAFAQQPDAPWQFSSHDGSCSITYSEGEGRPFLILNQASENAYGIGGTAIDGIDFESGENPEITAKAGGKSVALLGPEVTSMRRANRWGGGGPIFELGTLLEDQESFVLRVAGSEYEVPLDGFDEAHAALLECTKELTAQALVQAGGRAPQLIAFEGMERLGAEASRQRLLSEKLGYTITVDAQGKPTDCALSREFRRRATEIALCRPFLRDATFEPALDAEGNAVEGTFFIEVDFDMWMTQRGYLEAEDR